MPIVKRAKDDTIGKVQSVGQLAKRRKTGSNANDLLEFGINNLNDDCLEHILEFFDLQTLVNVADTSKRLRQVTKSVFKRKHAKKKVEIRLNSCLQLSNLKLLRNFGDLIEHLSVKQYPYRERVSIIWSKALKTIQQKMIREYIIEYCSGSDALKIFELFWVPKGVFNAIMKPFRSVEVFKHFGPNLSGKISHFNQWFPKMRHLELNFSDVSSRHKRCVEMKFPLLEHLKVDDHFCDSSEVKHSNRCIGRAISMNPQLRSIYLCFPALQNPHLLNHNLPELEKLELCVKVKDYEKRIDEIKFSKVKQLYIAIKDYLSEDSYQQAMDGMLSISFDRLEELEVHSYSRAINLSWLKFARPNNLKILKFNRELVPSTSMLMEIAKQWPNLEEISLKIGLFSVSNLVDLMNKLNRLKKFQLLLYYYSDSNEKVHRFFHEMKFKIDKEWKAIAPYTFLRESS